MSNPTPVAHCAFGLTCLSFAVALASSSPLVAQSDDARKIVDEAQRRSQSKSQRYEGVLQVFDAKGTISDKHWTFERIGWVLMGVVMLGAAAGFFGGGLFTGSEATAGDDLTVRYPRFARADAPFDLAIDWLPRQADASLWKKGSPRT